MRPAIQCGSCKHLRSPLDSGNGTGPATCTAFPDGIPDEVWLNQADHRMPISGDHGVRWEALEDAEFPDYAMETTPVGPGRRKHLPGRHNQESHGNRNGRAAVIDWPARIASGVTDDEMLSDRNNASQVYLFTFGDGSRAVLKYPKADPEIGRGELDAEELGATVARTLGLHPPEVYRADELEAYFTYLGDTEPDAVLGAATDFDRAAASKDAKRIGLLDVLTENTDRNNGNWFEKPNGDLIPIDHGMSWEAARVERNGAETAPWPAGFSGEYTEKVGPGMQPGQWGWTPEMWEARWVDNDLSPAYVASLRPRLAALRPEFERLGRADWHDRMMSRLDIVEQHAKGTVTL